MKLYYDSIMLFIRTLLKFVFVFSLVGANWSYANKIKNCSNCSGSENEKGIELNSDKNILYDNGYYINKVINDISSIPRVIISTKIN